MSLFGKLFSTKKGEPQPTSSEAIQKLHELEETLAKKQVFLETKVERELDIARKNGSKNKQIAIQALKRKKHYEKQLREIDGTLSTIELQREALQNATINITSLETIKSASNAVKVVQKNINLEELHEVMDDMAEQKEIADKISIAFTQPAFGQDDDEEELLRELEELEQEELDKEMLNIKPIEFPEVPSTNLPEKSKETKKQPVKENDMDTELEQLMTWTD